MGMEVKRKAKRPIMIYMDEDLIQDLKQLADEVDMKLSAYIRYALAKHVLMVKRRREKKKE